ncbi:MAG: NINE protein [Porcipelethomonas sp.]
MFCQKCGSQNQDDAIKCVNCGETLNTQSGAGQPVINIVNTNTNTNTNVNPAVAGHPKNKWVAFFLCLFTFCGHKFYEGKIGMGILYLFTAGLFGIGWIIDLITLLTRPNPYYVRY